MAAMSPRILASASLRSPTPTRRRRKSLAEQCGAKVAGIDAILADKDIGAVVICTPTDTHADLIEKAAQAGKAVFCEKPVDLDSDRIRECLTVVKKHDAKLMIGFNRRFDPSFADVRRRIDAGEIGKVELVTILSRDPSPPPAEYVARSGGLFRDMMIHDLDMARFLLGEEPVEVHAVGSCLVDPASARPATSTPRRCCSRPRAARSRRSPIRAAPPTATTSGSKCTARRHAARPATGTRPPSRSRMRGGYRSDPALPFFLERYAEAYRAELDAFVAAVLDGKPIAPSGEDGLKAQILADAATQVRPKRPAGP